MEQTEAVLFEQGYDVIHAVPPKTRVSIRRRSLRASCYRFNDQDSRGLQHASDFADEPIDREHMIQRICKNHLYRFVLERNRMEIAGQNMRVLFPRIEIQADRKASVVMEGSHFRSASGAQTEHNRALLQPPRLRQSLAQEPAVIAFMPRQVG